MQEEISPLVNQLTALVRHFQRLLTSVYVEELSLGDAAVSLLKLLSKESSSQITQARLADELCLSESSLCTMIEKLRSEHLLIRERLVTDRRKTRLALTEMGSRKIDEILRVDRALERSLLQHLRSSLHPVSFPVLEELTQASRQSETRNSAAKRAA